MSNITNTWLCLDHCEITGRYFKWQRERPVSSIVFGKCQYLPHSESYKSLKSLAKTDPVKISRLHVVVLAEKSSSYSLIFFSCNKSLQMKVLLESSWL